MSVQRQISVVLASTLIFGSLGLGEARAQSTTYAGCLDCVEEVPRRCSPYLTGPCSEVCEQLAHGESGLSNCIQGEAWEGDIYVCATYGGNCSSTGPGTFPPQMD